MRLRPRPERLRSTRLAPRLRRRARAASLLGYRLRDSWGRDRPTRQAAWPGEDPAPTIQDFTFTDRDTEFVEFVITQVRKRQEAEDEFYANLADDEAP